MQLKVSDGVKIAFGLVLGKFAGEVAVGLIQKQAAKLETIIEKYEKEDASNKKKKSIHDKITIGFAAPTERG